ncbi:MAG TPA: TIM barrel protein [Acidothermaceae bacterium]
MRSSIATVSVSGSLEEKLPTIAAAGFDGIELFEADLIASPLRPVEIAERVSDLGLTIELYQPFRDFEALPKLRFQRNLLRAEAKIELMATLGVDLMLVCSNVSAEAIDDRDLAAEHLRALGDLASGAGIRIAYEALAWGTHVRHYADAYDIVRRARHPAVGICLDSFHIMSVGDSLDEIAQIESESLLFVQLADAPHQTMDVLRLSRHYRCFPGQGTLDLASFTTAVLRAGYRGPLSLEVFSDTVRAAPADQIAHDARRSLRYLEDATRRELERGGSLGTIGTAELRLLPPVPKVDGIAFIEVAVAGPMVSRFSAWLQLFGFTLVGVHRSKAVQLWQQGDVRVVLNSQAQVGDRPSVVGIGLHTPDIDTAVRRAADLRLPFDDQHHAPNEADLPSVTTPMGLQLVFCGLAEPYRWRADFIDTGDLPRGVGAQVVDHLGGTVSADLYDAEISLYRLLLGMTAGPVAEINRPHGQLQSRALTNADATLRIAISAGVVGRSSPPGLQQIALSTHDVVGTARSLRAAGAQMLAIPDNYYADLAARYDLLPSQLDEMRSVGVLYDRSDDGEFLHTYSASIGGLFFEFVQRIGHYSGFGEADTSIRLASQEPN